MSNVDKHDRTTSTSQTLLLLYFIRKDSTQCMEQPSGNTNGTTSNHHAADNQLLCECCICHDVILCVRSKSEPLVSDGCNTVHLIDLHGAAYEKCCQTSAAPNACF